MPRLTTGFGRLSLPVACPGLTGRMTPNGATGIGGIGLTSGTGFFMRETEGLTFGMPGIMRLPMLEIKPAVLLESFFHASRP